MILFLAGILFSLLAIWIVFVIFLQKKGYRIWFFDVTKLFPGYWKPADIGKYYNEWNEQYKKYYGDTIQAHRPENLQELQDYILKSAEINDGMKIIDAGCGICGPSIYFAKNKDISIEAVSISDVQVAEAQENISKNDLDSKIKVHCADFHNLHKMFPKGEFDRVLFLESYGHASNQKNVLSSAHQVLKKSGFIYIKDYFSTDLSKDKFKNKLMKNAIRNLNKEYRYNAADLYFTIYWLRQLNFKIHFIKTPDFILNNEKVVNEFEKANKIDLFGNEYKPYIVEPFEIFAEKTE